jgi:hypothetical protein
MLTAKQEQSRDMVDLAKTPFDAEVEAQFRRGFTHGAQRVISAVEPYLKPAQLSKLKNWMAEDVGDWQKGSEAAEPPSPPDLSA